MRLDFQYLRNEVLFLKCLHAASGERKNSSLAALCLILGAIVSTAWNVGEAQTAYFTGIQSVVASSGLTFPCGVAVDGNGNVYVADQGPDTVFKESLSGSTYTQSTVVSGLNLKCGIAVDSAGNVYVADYMFGQVLKETPSGSGYAQSVVASGLSFPNGIAVDRIGNVFIADTDNDRVLKETLTGSTYSQSTVVSGLATPVAVAVDGAGAVYIAVSNYASSYAVKETPSGSGYVQSTVTSSDLFSPTGIAVDGSGNVYVSDALGDGILKDTPSGSGYTQTVVGSYGLNSPSGIAVDGDGSVYVGDRNNGRVVKETQASGDFGSVNIGSSSAPMSLVFRFDAAATIGAPVVVMQGLTGLDFADAGTGSCTTNGTNYPYVARNTCLVDVIFKPRSAGARFGAAVLQDNEGNVLATGYVQGTGVGPLVNFLPGTQSVVAKGTFTPIGMAVDAGGNIYFADSSRGQLLKETLSGGTYTQSTVAAGLNGIWQVAVDGSGSVYVAQWDDAGSAGQVFKETPSSNGYVQSTIGSGFFSPWGVAVDGSGNVYIADGYYGAVYKETLTAGTYTQSTIVSGLVDHPLQIAVDANGNVYVADVNADSVLKETPSSGSYTSSTIGSGLNSPYGIAIDSSGDVYIADTGNNRVLKETPSGSTYIQSTLAGGLNNPDGVAVDGSGNVYIADSFNYQVLEENYNGPPALTFKTTAYGTASADSPQTVALENVGNAALIFPVPATGDNPSISANFSLNSGEASACPLVAAGSSTAGTLAAGTSCQLAVSFVPAAVGSLSGSLLLTDNHLNAAPPGYATQSIMLNGSATPPAATITWATPAPISYGTNLSSVLNATAEAGGQSIPGVFSYTATPTGGAATAVTATTVPATGSYILNAVFTPTNTVDYTTATATANLTVNKAISTISLVGSPNAAFVSNPVTFTATLSSSAGTPTGSVSFYDGSTLLGAGGLTSGVATYTTSGLVAGSHSITATYSGDSNFLSGIISPLTETVEDFTFGASGGGTIPSQTVSPGGQAVYTMSIAPPSGTALAGPITFTVTGLPAGATATFSPTTVALGSPATDVTMAVAVPKQSAALRLERLFSGEGLPAAMALILLPCAGLLRRSSRRFSQMVCVLLIGMGGTVLVAGLAGCGGSSSSGGNSGSQPQSYTLTITATSGSLSHVVTTGLTVE